MLAQISCGLRAESGAKPIYKIFRQHSVDRPNIHFTGMTLASGFHKVLYECLCTENEIFKSLQLLYTMNKGIHAAFALCKFHCTILVPESLIPHHRVGLALHFGFPLEELSLDGGKGVVAHPGDASDEHLGEKRCYLHLHNHIIA